MSISVFIIKDFSKQMWIDSKFLLSTVHKVQNTSSSEWSDEDEVLRAECSGNCRNMFCHCNGFQSADNYSTYGHESDSESDIGRESDDDMSMDSEYYPPPRIHTHEHIFHNITHCHAKKIRLIMFLPLPADINGHINTFLSGSRIIRHIPYFHSSKYCEREKLIETEEREEGCLGNLHSLFAPGEAYIPSPGERYFRMHSAIRYFSETGALMLLRREHPMETIQKVLDAHISNKAWPHLAPMIEWKEEEL